MSRPHRPVAALLAAAGALALAACSTEPDPSCNRLVGQTLVVADSLQAAEGLRVAVGDSVRIIADVREVKSASASEIIAGGTICLAKFGDALPITVEAQSANTSVAVVRPGLWVVGRAIGGTAIRLTAAGVGEPTDLFVTVVAPN